MRKQDLKLERGKRKKYEYDEPVERVRWHADLHPETKHGVLAIIFFTLAAVFILSLLNLGGKAGETLYGAFDYLLGTGYVLIPAFLLAAGGLFLFSHRRKIVVATIIGGSILLLSILALMNILFGPAIGGAVGSLVSVPLLDYFDFWGSLVIVGGIGLSSLLLLFNLPLFKKKPEGLEHLPEKKIEIAPTAVEEKKSMLDSIKEAFPKKALSDAEAVMSTVADEPVGVQKEEAAVPLHCGFFSDTIES